MPVFARDALDNLKTADQGDRQYRYVYNALNRLSQINNPQGATQFILGYNAVGDVVSKHGRNYTFDAAHRLLGVPAVVDYTYDGNGRRVKELSVAKKGEIPEYGVYNQAGQKLFKKKADTTTRNIYLAGTLLASTDTTLGISTTSYLHTDALGSVVAKSDNNGLITARYRYAPYGESVGLAGGLLVDGLGYTGHDMDADTGLTYMQQRYYDPVIARFLSVDPVAASAGSFNRYWYANSNPYVFTDPDGRKSFGCTGTRTAAPCANSSSSVKSFGSGVGSSIGRFLLPTTTALPSRGTSGTWKSNTVGALKQGANSLMAMLKITNPALLLQEDGEFEIADNEMEGAAGAETLMFAAGGVGAIRSVAAKFGSGVATVIEHAGKHASVMVRTGNTVLHTEQIVLAGGETTISVVAGATPAVRSFSIVLPDAAAAIRYQQSALGQSMGSYNAMTNSCVTHCGDVLRAGGVNAPTTTRSIVRWLQNLGGE